MGEPSTDENAAFGRAVTARRAELGLTRKDIAERTGLSYSYVSNIEAGHKQPSIKVLHALADALDLGVGDLLERVNAVERLAQTARQTRAPQDGTLSRGSWFRGEISAPMSRSAPPADEMRSLVREIVREELSYSNVDEPASAPPAPVLASMAAPRPTRPPELAPAIRAVLPDWLTAPAHSATDLALQALVVERLHRIPRDASPEEVHQSIDESLEILIKQARRRRRKPAPKPK